MKCEEAQELLHPFFDGELDVVAHVQVEEHFGRVQRMCISSEGVASTSDRPLGCSVVSSCPVLASHAAAIYYRGGSQRRRPQARWSYPRLAAIAAGVLLLIGVSAFTAMYWSNARTADDRFAELVVAAHVRSLLANHVTDVVSTDQHTVKPWFDGKLDFAPQVPDLTSQGYTLSGGRLDYLLDRPVAAIIYFRRLHPINLFTWPATNGGEEAVEKISRQGFHIRRWEHAGMAYWAISDVSDRDLDEFVQDFQQQSPVTSR